MSQAALLPKQKAAIDTPTQKKLKRETISIYHRLPDTRIYEALKKVIPLDRDIN